MSNSQLKSNITESISNEDIESDTLSYLKRGEYLLKKIENKHGKDSDIYIKYKKEYNELIESIKSSLKIDNNITKLEIKMIKLELTNLERISKEKKEGSIFDKFSAIAKGLGLETKDLEDLGIDTSDLNTTQNELIEKIIGNKNGFNETKIAGYNNEVGNYIINISEFEEKIRNNEINIRDINSVTLSNYFKYLNFKGTKLEDFPNILGKNILEQLGEIWRNPKKGDTLIAKKEIQKYSWGKDIIQYISLFSSPTEFIANISKFNPEQQNLALVDLNNNVNNLKNKLKNELLDLIKINNPQIEEKEAVIIVNEMITEIGNIKHNKGFNGLKNSYDIFSRYDSKYNLGMDKQLITNKSLQINEKIVEIEIITTQKAIKKAKKEGIDTSELNNLLITQNNRLLNLNQNIIVNNEISNEDIDDIVSGEIDFNQYIEELINNNTELKEKIEKLEKNKVKTKKKAKKYKTKTFENLYIQNSIENSNSSYDYNVNKGEINIPGEDKKLLLNPIEQNIVKNNPETLDNIVDFYKTLKKIGLDNLWNIKDQIFTGIKNSVGIGFSIDKNYLNENEIKIFINSILKSIGEAEISPVFNIKSFIAKVIQKNGVQLGGAIKDTNYKGESKIENIFMKKYFPKGNIKGFEVSKFEKELKK